MICIKLAYRYIISNSIKSLKNGSSKVCEDKHESRSDNPKINTRNCPISCLQAAFCVQKNNGNFKAQFRLKCLFCFIQGRLQILNCSFLKISPISLILVHFSRGCRQQQQDSETQYFQNVGKAQTENLNVSKFS